MIVDRLTAGSVDENRLADSLETALSAGHGRCVVLTAADDTDKSGADEAMTLDGREWRWTRFNERLACDGCEREFQEPEPRLFSFNAPLGACAECEGFGAISAISFEKLVPDPTLSLREGAIVPWTTPAYEHELHELLALADDYDVPADIPFAELEDRHLELIRDGVPERDFGGLRGFFRWLERHRYKTGVRVFLARWRAYEPCPECQGSRLNPSARAVGINGRNIADVCRQTIDDVAEWFDSDLMDSEADDETRRIAEPICAEIRSRLHYLRGVGLGYLTLDRTMRTLSGGEAQRVALTSALGSSLVNTLYVLDEPSAGLHPADSRRVIESIRGLCAAGNTLVVVEHDQEFVRQAHHAIEIGPGAGGEGGRLVYTGDPDGLRDCEQSATGRWLRSERSVPFGTNGRRTSGVSIRLSGIRHHNLDGIDVEFPLGVLCVVTGVSGSGKSSLVHETLYPTLCRQTGQTSPLESHGQYESLEGADAVSSVVMVDQQPIGRSARSNPVTYLKAFDEVRSVFAATPEAKLRNFTASTFSFNAAQGGRCPKCEGHGSIAIDMQFLADVSITCPECQGTRYRAEVLECRYRGLSIAEVLAMTADEAFGFFRAQSRLQKRLRFLRDVGLGYVPLGQPATTLSGGESQRLKLTAHMAGVGTSGSNRKPGTGGMLILLDEPTVGLHAADVQILQKCFNALLEVGHSLIVIEHDLQIMAAADHVIDLGPGAGDAGGRVVAEGTPEKIAEQPESQIGQALRAYLSRE